MNSKLYLGIELGSTRIKATGIDESFIPIITGDFTWKSAYRDGIWTYSLDDLWRGMRSALAPFAGKKVDVIGISGMMHGYLAFDRDWNLLVPFRTWQNTVTEQAASQLSQVFGLNIPQRWSIAHLYQAILNNEAHIKDIAHITTLAGYVHHALTGQNVLGIGEASGMFPIDSSGSVYDPVLLGKFDKLAQSKGFTRNIIDILPCVLPAGKSAGRLTADGSQILDGLLAEGIPFAPCEGDAETGMTATNTISGGKGNASVGTSIFAMVVLDKPLSKAYPEIDMVCTPDGKPVAMVHCNNGTNDINAWFTLLEEAVTVCGGDLPPGDLYTRFYTKSLEADDNCGGITICNYLAGESITHMNEGRPLVVRNADSRFSLANFIRAQLYSAMATLRIGMDILNTEGVSIDSLVAHGGFFATPVVGQKYMAAAFNAPVTCMETAGNGGPFGMALLAAYTEHSEVTLETFLNDCVFATTRSVTLVPDKSLVSGFSEYLGKFKNCLEVEASAIDNIE